MKAWRELIEIAIHAPSPHNVQPWRVRISSDTEAELLIEKDRTLPKEDVTGSFIILTMGLFIEALSLLAANRGLRLSYEPLQKLSQFTPDKIEQTEDQLLPFAVLKLEPAESKPLFSDSLFMQRRTSRLPFLPEAVPTDASNALSRVAQDWSQRYEQVTDGRTIERLLEYNTDALFEDLNTTAYHDEIVEWFRFTNRSSRRTRDGLDFRCMNSSRLSFWMVARFPELLQFSLTSPMLRRIYRKQLGPVPTLGILSGRFWEPDDAFETGRFLMRFWLELARHNLYLHPYGNLVTNRAAAARCLAVLGIPDIWLIFKVGYSKEPPKSHRRSVEEVLVD